MLAEPVNILMATYNGCGFISAQITSIINQTYTNWNLFIRDDGSTDNTVEIITGFIQNDKRIHIITDNLGNLKSCQNFSALMNRVKNDASYTMFCDQDDVWLPSKIELTLKKMIDLDILYSFQLPLLVCTNFIYVNENLERIKSKKNFNAFKIKNLSFSNLLAQNPIYGCTIMANKKLLERTGKIPNAAENHDYWIALVASVFGKIIYLSKRTILYRQHNKNISGQHNNNSFKKRFIRNIIKNDIAKDVKAKLYMAEEFKVKYYSLLSRNQQKIVNSFIELFYTKSLRLILKNLQNGVRRQTILQTLLFYLKL